MVDFKVYLEQIAAFCQQRHIRWLMVYGAVLRSDFRPDEDIDILVKYEPKHAPGLFGMLHMERQLSALFDGRKVNLRTLEDLSHYHRQDVLAEAEIIYEKR